MATYEQKMAEARLRAEALDDDTLRAAYDRYTLLRMQKAVDAAVATAEKTLVAQIIDAARAEAKLAVTKVVRVDFENTARTIAVETVAKFRESMREAAEKYIADNVEKLVGVRMSQTIDQAMSDFRRRILGRG